MNLQSACQCGETKLNITGKAISRGYCHCLICQEFNQAPYSDVAIFYADDVEIPDEKIEFVKFGESATALPRGKCKACGKPVVEKMKIPGLPAMVFIPAETFTDADAIPAPALHMFYHRRVEDMQDKLPKYSGSLGSQLGFMRQLLPAMLKHRQA